MISDLTYFLHLTAHLIENIITISIFGFLLNLKKLGLLYFYLSFRFFIF